MFLNKIFFFANSQFLNFGDMVFWHGENFFILIDFCPRNDMYAAVSDYVSDKMYYIVTYISM